MFASVRITRTFHSLIFSRPVPAHLLPHSSLELVVACVAVPKHVMHLLAQVGHLGLPTQKTITTGVSLTSSML